MFLPNVGNVTPYQSVIPFSNSEIDIDVRIEDIGVYDCNDKEQASATIVA